MTTDDGVQAVGFPALAVHAIDDRARLWYSRFGFESSPTDCHHLILLAKDLRKLFESA